MIAVLLAAGLAALVAGAGLLVRGASKLAAGLGVPPLIVGLTLVAYGTSAPELAVSLRAAASDQSGLALGNVVGSNIFNVFFVLGASALLRPLVVSLRLVRRDVWIMIGASALLIALGLDGRLGRPDGAVLTAAILLYTAMTIRGARGGDPAPPGETSTGGGGRAWLIHGALTVAGVALLVLGSRWLVQGASAVARALSMSELLIGLTIVAAGTSLPEAATSLFAALRGERDIAVGNVVGSNIFNILGILGPAALLAPRGIDVPAPALSLDLPLALAAAVACLPIFFTGGRIARWEGCFFLACYAAYVWLLVRLATAPPPGSLVIGYLALVVLIPAAALAAGLIRTRR